ncbi:MAG: diguanylate cyclase, partial [Halieaceae bacterium]|nr:diguanylate cyclase [Halieaceae bacterium]
MSSEPATADRPINVLVVDDRSENLFAMKKILRSLDAKVFTAQSGNEALGLMLHNDFAVALLDVQMPEMDGFELASLMKDNKKTQNIPIIFVTALSKEDRYIFKGYENGAVDYLFKPLNADILKSKVTVFLRLALQQQVLESANQTIRQQQDHIVEEERLKVLLQVAGATAHDLNQPLTALLGSVELLQLDKDNPERLGKHLAAIDKAGQRIASMVKRIQLIRHGQVTPEMRKASVDRVRPLSNIRLLCIEDSDDDYCQLEELMKSMGNIDWSRACSIDEGIAALSAGNFDLVFLDYILPDGTGLDFMKRAIAENLDVPVIAITGQADSMVASELIKAGAYDYLSKDKLNAAALHRIMTNSMEMSGLRQEVVEAQKKMAEMSTTDGLTGLNNRRFFNECLERECSRALRYNIDLVLCMVDLDHFKTINDSHGHVAGDAVLAEIGQLLHHSFRQADIACRYGGEEFAVILPNTTSDKAHLVCERFRRTVAAQKFHHQGIDMNITVSAGLVALQKLDNCNAEELLRVADQALYDAKAQGRNR